MNVTDTLSTTTDTSEEPAFRELSTASQITRTVLGLGLFASWLMLFVCGMSLNSGDYRDLIFRNEVFDTKYLFLYALTFTPINVALLSALAGVLGGFASNLTASNQFHYMRNKMIHPESDEFKSYVYMTENPLVSMLRGFITYMIFIAGSYLTNFTTSVDPNDNASFIGLSASSYFKFAVSVSLLAYLAGYDPSRMKTLVNSIGITKKDAAAPTRATVVTHQTTESLQVATTGAGTQPVLNGQPVKAVD
ncbi:hypothetical protein [Spirosoma rigui]|uniref:hypothetical protein n=1 Tax=Spirosoma rigui TaxID=564064 RepID=UPI0009B1509A|nr:hypothetical protein [Spirosoma rigui]